MCSAEEQQKLRIEKITPTQSKIVTICNCDWILHISLLICGREGRSRTNDRKESDRSCSYLEGCIAFYFLVYSLLFHSHLYEVFEAEQVAVGNLILNLRPTKELR